MSYQEVVMYRLMCDRCRATAQDGDYYAWTSKDDAELEARESGWLTGPGHFCGACTTWDEDADELVPLPAARQAGEEAGDG